MPAGATHMPWYDNSAGSAAARRNSEPRLSTHSKSLVTRETLKETVITMAEKTLKEIVITMTEKLSKRLSLLRQKKLSERLSLLWQKRLLKRL